jgi:hypothetical protein
LEPRERLRVTGPLAIRIGDSQAEIFSHETAQKIADSADWSCTVDDQAEILRQAAEAVFSAMAVFKARDGEVSLKLIDGTLAFTVKPNGEELARRESGAQKRDVGGRESPIGSEAGLRSPVAEQAPGAHEGQGHPEGQ